MWLNIFKGLRKIRNNKWAKIKKSKLLKIAIESILGGHKLNYTEDINTLMKHNALSFL